MLPIIASNGVPYLQMTSVGLHGMSWREKGGWGRTVPMPKKKLSLKANIMKYYFFI